MRWHKAACHACGQDELACRCFSAPAREGLDRAKARARALVATLPCWPSRAEYEEVELAWMRVLNLQGSDGGTCLRCGSSALGSYFCTDCREDEDQRLSDHPYLH